MDISRYFCNLYQAYLMATNTSELSSVTLYTEEEKTLYHVPGKQELTLYFNRQPKLMVIRITTNYKTAYNYTRQYIYHRASDIEALSYRKRYYGAFYSIVLTSEDGKTLLITRGIYL